MICDVKQSIIFSVRQVMCNAHNHTHTHTIIRKQFISLLRMKKAKKKDINWFERILKRDDSSSDSGGGGGDTLVVTLCSSSRL